MQTLEHLGRLISLFKEVRLVSERAGLCSRVRIRRRSGKQRSRDLAGMLQEISLGEGGVSGHEASAYGRAGRSRYD